MGRMSDCCGEECLRFVDESRYAVEAGFDGPSLVCVFVEIRMQESCIVEEDGYIRVSGFLNQLVDHTEKIAMGVVIPAPFPGDSLQHLGRCAPALFRCLG